jgi:hypothetical protein
MKFLIKLFRYFFQKYRLVLSKTSLYFDEIIGVVYICFIKRKILLGSKRLRPVVLICRYGKFGNGKDESMEKYHIDNTLKNFDVDVLNFFWDNTIFPGLNKLRFIKFVMREVPDLMVLSSYTPSSKRALSQPGRQILDILKDKNYISKCIAVWWDTCSKNFPKINLRNQRAINFHVIIDNPTMNLDYTQICSEDKEKLLFLFCPYNINCLFKPLKKDINFSFLGQINSYRNTRREFVDYLTLNNIEGYLSTDERSDQVSHEKYGEILGRSKIGLNFSYSVDKHQLKGRVFETILAGALLLESKNDQTAALFEDGEEFVSFTTKEDLLEKIKHYVFNDIERNRIAENGRRKVMELYNGFNFWQIIFQKLKFNV